MEASDDLNNINNSQCNKIKKKIHDTVPNTYRTIDATFKKSHVSRLSEALCFIVCFVKSLRHKRVFLFNFKEKKTSINWLKTILKFEYLIVICLFSV